MSKVLVAFATKYGSTKEVAEAVAEVLSDRGYEVTLSPARDVKSLEGFSAAVLGTALYYFRPLKDGRRFLSRHAKALERMPFALFGMGPFNNKEDEFAEARKELDKVLAKHPSLKPVAVEAFGGKFDPTGLTFPDANPAMKGMPASDIRDFDAIRAWAGNVADMLRS